MQRVMVVGSGGSGKSTLAPRLGEILDLPVYHLDSLFWHPGWQATPKPEWQNVQRELVDRPEWIIDGNYTSSMEVRLTACDTVVFLDLPTWTCLLGVLQRYLRYWDRTRPDMGEGCKERLDWRYLGWIVSYRWRRRPRVLRHLEGLDPNKQVIILHSRQEIEQWLSSLQQSE